MAPMILPQGCHVGGGSDSVFRPELHDAILAL
jgi:hypothetical protein